MAAIKDLAKIREKFIRVTQERTADYEEGIQNPRTDWAQATGAAEKTYNDGVTKAIQRKAFSKGVAKAGTSKWQLNALAKGPNRFAEGVALGGDAYQEGFAPYHQIIASLQLPPRFPKGDPRNFDRVKAIGEALRKRKEQGT